MVKKIQTIIEDVEYTVKGDTLVGMKYVGVLDKYIDTFTLPDAIKGQHISRIGSKIFDLSLVRHLKINKLIIPNWIIEIKPEAFKSVIANEIVWSENCSQIPEECFSYSSIKKISNIENVTLINKNAFECCLHLNYIKWPPKCKRIPQMCFFNCKSLKEFDFKNIKFIEESAFAKSGLPHTLNTEEVESIEKKAFEDCENLKEFIWPNACKVIPLRCFKNSGLQRIYNIKSVETIEDGAFERCIWFKEITWPENCKIIPYSCFFGCDNLISFSFKNIEEVNKFAFLGSGLKTATETSLIKKIEEGAFFDCKSLKEFIWPDTCSTIPPQCFSCSGIEKISNLKAVKEIQEGAFNECPLKTIDLRESIIYNAGVNIDDRAFNNINDIVFLT